MDGGARPVFGRETSILVVIAFGAIALRLVRLGELSLAGDEETTALAALALLDGWPPSLPGGLIYLRGLPFTFLEAGAIAVAGVDEFALRLTPALAGGARVVASWWLARSFLAPGSALAVAGLMAIAPFDIEFSRIARMYSLFAALDLVFVAWVVRLILGGRGAAGAALVGAASAFTHQLALLHAPLPLIAAAVPGLPHRVAMRLVAVAVVPFAGYFLYARSLAWGASGLGESVEAAGGESVLAGHALRIAEATATPLAGVLAAVGVLTACVLTIWALRDLRPWIARLSALIAGLAWIGASPVMGFAVMLGALILAGTPFTALGPAGQRLIGAGVVATLGWGLAAFSAGPGLAGGLESAARLLLGFPSPNWFEFGLAMPGLFVLAAFGALVAVERGANSRTAAIWLVLLAAALSPALVGGLVRRAESLRFQLHALAPLLVLAFLAVETLAARFLGRRALVLAASILVVAMALRPDQSLRILLREHGPVSEPFSALGVAPDHRGAAEFVRANALPNDRFAAEDALQQRLYLGRLSFWLRRFEDASQFVRRDPRDGILRDIYVGARQVSDIEALQAVVRADAGHDVWLITSGEAAIAPEYYRTPETQRTLEAWRPLAWFVGADKMTRVYLLVDGVPQPKGSDRGATDPEG
jgi:hypothetical protein